MTEAIAATGPPAAAPVAAVIVGGTLQTRGEIAWRLGAAGLDVSRNGSGPASRPATLLIVVDGAADARALRDAAERHPGARVLAVVSDGASNAALRRAMRAGVSGIVREGDVDRALVATAQALVAGQLAVPRGLGRDVAPQPLSHRERQILSLVVLGLTNAEIGRRLYLAESTVKTHLSSAFRKLDVRSRAEATARIQDLDAGDAPGFLDSVAIAD